MGRNKLFPTVFNNFKQHLRKPQLVKDMALLSLMGHIERPLCYELALYIAKYDTYVYPRTEICAFTKKGKDENNAKKPKRLFDLGVQQKSDHELLYLVEAKYVTNLHHSSDCASNDNIPPALNSLYAQLKNPRGMVSAGKGGGIALHGTRLYGILFCCYKSPGTEPHTEAMQSWQEKYIDSRLSHDAAANPDCYPETVKPDQEPVFTNHLVNFAGEDWRISLQMSLMVKGKSALYGP